MAPPSLAVVVESIQQQPASKWLWPFNHLAARLQISIDEAYEFVLRIQNGGTGVRKDGSWAANPAPYDRKIDLTKHEDNALNLHVVDTGHAISEGSEFQEPSPPCVECCGRYVRLGRVRTLNKGITPKVQRKIVRYVLGTHKTLSQFYPKIAKRRKKTWRRWIEGDNQFQTLDLP